MTRAEALSPVAQPIEDEVLEKIGRLVEIEELRTAGGPGSGNFGHKGRPGKVGGSSTEGGSESNTLKLSPKTRTVKMKNGNLKLYPVKRKDGRVVKVSVPPSEREQLDAIQLPETEQERIARIDREEEAYDPYKAPEELVDDNKLVDITAEDVVLYHGTTSAARESIREKGLVPGGGQGADEWLRRAAVSGDNFMAVLIAEKVARTWRPPSVFMSPQYEYVKNYASKVASLYPGSESLILRVNIPSEVASALRGDELDSKAYRLPRTIPPAWISVVEDDGSPKALVAGKVRDTFYAVIMVDGGVE